MTTTSKVLVLGLLLTLLGVGSPPGSASPTAVSGRRLVTLDVPSALVDPTVLGGTLTDAPRNPRVNVLLPAGYDDHPGADYPVLYLLHGANGGYEGWIDPDQVDASELLAGLPAVIVMPDGGTYGMYSSWWKKGTRSGPSWTDFHLRTVKDLVEDRFRIRDGRRWHAIAGISMGGQGTLRYAAMLPGYFGSAAALSPALPDMRSPIAYVGLTALVGANGSGLVTYEDIWGPPNGWYARANNPADLLDNLAATRLYLSSGNGVSCPGDPLTATYPLDVVTELGIRTVTTGFASRARRAGIDVTERRTCGVHTFGVWDRAFADILATWDLFAPVPESPTSWTYRTGLQHGRMWQLDYSFSAPMTSFTTFTRSGSTLRATGAGTVTLRTPGCTFAGTLPFTLTLPAGCAG